MPNLRVEMMPHEFYYNGVRSPDPAPLMTAEQSWKRALACTQQATVNPIP
jgi:hypothetical protein